VEHLRVLEHLLSPVLHVRRTTRGSRRVAAWAPSCAFIFVTNSLACSSVECCSYVFCRTGSELGHPGVHPRPRDAAPHVHEAGQWQGKNPVFCTTSCTITHHAVKFRKLAACVRLASRWYRYTAHWSCTQHGTSFGQLSMCLQTDNVLAD
jgi:hypothetical protein